MPKVAVVTGGSRGIGKAISLAMGRAGCTVVVNYVANESGANEVCSLIEKEGGRAIPFRADTGDHNQVSAMFHHINKTLGRVGILVNNAGVIHNQLAVRTSPDDFCRLVNINLNGTFFCCREAILSMLPNKEGRIINIASVVAQTGNIGQSSYGASKAGLIGLTKSLAKEYGARGICVNAVCPGFIETEMTQDVDKTRMIANIPLGRFGKPSEVAGLVEFLAISRSAAYITGHCFNIDGGLAIGAT